MHSAKIELQLDNPIEYIEIIEGPEIEGRTVEFKESNGMLEINISADDTKSLLGAIDSIIKKITIVSNARKEIQSHKTSGK